MGALNGETMLRGRDICRCAGTKGKDTREIPGVYGPFAFGGMGWCAANGRIVSGMAEAEVGGGCCRRAAQVPEWVCVPTLRRGQGHDDPRVFISDYRACLDVRKKG